MDMFMGPDWSQIDVAAALAPKGNAILRRCSELADTCWVGTPEGIILRHGYKDRASHVCHFVEWFYHLFSPEQRRSFKKWPQANVALALQVGNDTDRPSISDKAVANSVISKLNHVRLSHGETCRLCFTGIANGKRDIRILLSTLPQTEHTNLEDIETRVEVHQAQALITAACSSDIDCLLNYLGTHVTSDIQIGLDISQDAWKPVIKRWSDPGLSQHNFIRLRGLIQTARGRPIVLSTKPFDDWLSKLLQAAAPS